MPHSTLKPEGDDEVGLRMKFWGGMDLEVGRRFKGEETYVYLWLIHVDV